MATVFTRIIAGELPGALRLVRRARGRLPLGATRSGRATPWWCRASRSTSGSTPRRPLLATSSTVAHAVGAAIRAVWAPPRVGLLVAGFEVPHLHVHVFPAADMGAFDFANAARLGRPRRAGRVRRSAAGGAAGARGASGRTCPAVEHRRPLLAGRWPFAACRDRSRGRSYSRPTASRMPTVGTRRSARATVRRRARGRDDPHDRAWRSPRSGSTAGLLVLDRCLGRTGRSKPGARMRPSSEGGRPWRTSGWSSPCATIEQRNAHVRFPSRTITFRCEVTTLRLSLAAEEELTWDGLRRPPAAARFGPGRSPGGTCGSCAGRLVAAALCVDGRALLLIGSQTVPLRPTARDLALTVCSCCSGSCTPRWPAGSSGCAGASPRPPTSTSAPSGRSPPPCCSRRRSPRPSSSWCTCHLWLRVWRPAGMPLYRNVYTAAAVVLAAQAAHAVVSRPAGVPAGPRTWPGSRHRAGRARLRRGEQRAGRSA